MKSLAVHEQEKKLNLEEFFNEVNASGKQILQIKKNVIKLLNELVEDIIINNDIRLVFKSGVEKDQLIKNLITSDITRRMKYIKFHEKIQKF